MDLDREGVRALTSKPVTKDSNLVHSNGKYCNQFRNMIESMEELNVDDPDTRMAFQGASPLQIPFPSFNGPPQSMPYSVNLDMAMNNDILDLSKPLRGYPLRKGVSNISLDSLNDNYIEPNSDAFRVLSRSNSSTEGSLENLLELRHSIQDCNEPEDFSNFERWNNFVNLAKSQHSTTSSTTTTSYEQDRMHIVEDENTNLVNLNDEKSEEVTAKDALSLKGPFSNNIPNFHLPIKSRSFSSQLHTQMYGPIIHSAPAMENAASTASNSTMSFATTNSLKSDVTASPESYDMLYKSFEIAAMIDQEERKHGRTLTATVPNIEMLSPKLQRLRQVTMEKTSSSSPQPNFCSFGENSRQNEENEKPESESKKVTFADLAKQRQQQEREDEVRPQSLPVCHNERQHWTELLSSTKTPDFMKQSQQMDTLSPRRPQSLPIGLRHVTKPSSRPFPKEFTPDSFGSANVEPPSLHTPELGVCRTYSAPEGFARGDEERLIEEKCYDSVDNLAITSLTNACFINNNGFAGNWSDSFQRQIQPKISRLTFSMSTSRPQVLQSFDFPPPPPSGDDVMGYDDDYAPYPEQCMQNCCSCYTQVASDFDDDCDDDDDDDIMHVDRSAEVYTPELPETGDLIRFDDVPVQTYESVAVATQTESITVEEGTQTVRKKVTIAIPNKNVDSKRTSHKHKMKTNPSSADCVKDDDDVKRRRRSEVKADETTKHPLLRPRSASAGCQDSVSARRYSSNTSTPVKVRQSYRNKVLQQDLLGEVVYVENKPLKPIYVVDAEYNRRKGLPPPPGPPPVSLSIAQPILPATSSPPSVDFMDQPSFCRCDDVTTDIPLSAYEQSESLIEVNIAQKKGLVNGINSAVDLIVEHFGKSRHCIAKMKLGDSYYTPDIGHMVLRYLCPALTAVLSDGLQPHVRNIIVGRVKNTVWNVVQATTKLGPGTRQLHEITSHISQQSHLSDPMMKFNCFVFGLLNNNCMEQWLQHITSRTDVLESLYEADSFLRLANTGLKPLFEDLLVAIQPIAELPFRLDYKFEYNHIQDMKAREHGKQRLETGKKSFFSPFQLMKKVTQKTYERVTTKTQARCTPNDGPSSMDNDQGGSGKGWTVNWMRGLVNAGSSPNGKDLTTGVKSPKVTDMSASRQNTEPFLGTSKSQHWSLFGSTSFSKAFEGLMPDSLQVSTHALLVDPLHPFKAYRKGVSSEKIIPAHLAEELMGPRPDPAGASDSTASSPVWNFACPLTVRKDVIDENINVVQCKENNF